jgi:hypothetical protein
MLQACSSAIRRTRSRSMRFRRFSIAQSTTLRAICLFDPPIEIARHRPKMIEQCALLEPNPGGDSVEGLWCHARRNALSTAVVTLAWLIFVSLISRRTTREMPP